MVKITNGVKTFEVTKGAFRDVFSKQNYIEVKNVSDDKVPTTDGEEEVFEEDSETPEASGEEVDEDKAFALEIAERPIAQWSKKDVLRFAKIKGIDLSGVSSTNEAKERVKAVIS